MVAPPVEAEVTMALMFGVDESITCIQPVTLKGANDEQLCLAFKTSKIFFGAGVYLRDDGYVLKPVNEYKSYYHMPGADKVARFQQEGLLPSPLPLYKIPVLDYLFGYSLWIVIALAIVFSVLKGRATKRRRARDAATPVSLGPPVHKTPGDEFIASEVKPLLAPGEAVQHQAYGLTQRPDSSLVAAKNTAWFAVLTDRRLIFIKTRVGGFKPILENQGVEELDRNRVVNVVEDDYLMTFRLDDGTARTLWVAPQEKHFSNQRAFIRDIPRLLVARPAVQVQDRLADG
jgi:hypothetical protein